MSSVDLVRVTKRWGSVVAVDAVDLEVGDGELVALLGPSGCGKSTTLLLLAGIYAPSEGDILFDGARVNDVETRDRNVGIVFQSYALYPHLTVLDNIRFPLRFQHMSGEASKAKAEAAAKLVEVDGLLSRKPAELSGGQQQRVALARALVKAPRLLLLDEPLSNLDATLRLAMRSEIKRIQRETAVTTLLVTHDQIEATTMADRVVVMNGGRIEQVGTPEELYRAPATRFVAGFVGSPPMNFFPIGAVADGRPLLPLSQTPPSENAVPHDAQVGIRPEHLVPADHGLPARVLGIEPLGRETLTLVETPAGPARFLTAGAAPSPIDAAICLNFAPADTMVFSAAGARLKDVHVTPPAQ